MTYFKIKRGIPMLCRFGFASDLRSRDSKPLYSVNMFHCQLSVNSRIFIILSKSALTLSFIEFNLDQIIHQRLFSLDPTMMSGTYFVPLWAV